MSSPPSPLLADRFAPRSDFGRLDHLVVEADPTSTYKALHSLDLTDLHGFLVNGALRLRALPGRWREDRSPRQRTRLTLQDLEAGTDWVVLGEAPGHEIAFGAIGQFWRPVVKWAHVEARDFADFAEPGYAKVVCSLSTSAYGQRRTLVTAEVRVVLTDPRAWLSFRRYWRISTPFVGVISRAVLRTVRRSAEAGGVR